MSTVVLYVTGDEIGTFDSHLVKGKSNGTQVQLKGVEPLADINDTFMIVVTNVEPGETVFASVQFVSVYAVPQSDPSEPPSSRG